MRAPRGSKVNTVSRAYSGSAKSAPEGRIKGVLRVREHPVSPRQTPSQRRIQGVLRVPEHPVVQGKPSHKGVFWEC